MTRRDVRFQDELSVFVSLAIAIAILIAAIGGILVWSSIVKSASGLTIEKELDLP